MIVWYRISKFSQNIIVWYRISTFSLNIIVWHKISKFSLNLIVWYRIKMFIFLELKEKNSNLVFRKKLKNTIWKFDSLNSKLPRRPGVGLISFAPINVWKLDNYSNNRLIRVYIYLSIQVKYIFVHSYSSKLPVVPLNPGI